MRLGALGAERSVSVTVAAQRSLAHGALAERLASFVHAHPQAKLVTRSETGERVVELLRAQEVDLGVFLALGPVKGFASEIIGKEELRLVAAPSHPLAQRRSVSPVLLSEFGFVGGIAESHFAQIIDIVMRRLGVRRHRVVAEAQIDELEKRRKLREYRLAEGTRRFHVWVKSTRLGLSGKLDLLIDSPEGLFPVDFKMTTGQPHRNHVMQLCGYARLLEDCYQGEVTKGFVYLIPQNDAVVFDLTEEQRGKQTNSSARFAE